MTLKTIKVLLKKYFSRKGNAKRLEYWRMLLISFPPICLLIIVDAPFKFSGSIASPIFWLYFIFDFALWVFFALLFLTVILRRMTDIGIGKWYVLFLVFPYLFPYLNTSAVILLGLLKTDAARTPAVQAKIKKVVSLFKSK